MKKEPTVSIIVPNYNHEAFLKQRLESILNQTFQNFELLLLDDCSTDNSRKVLLEYSTHPKVSKVIINKTNTGNTFAQWNKGISLASGELIWIAESDDYCERNFLEKLVQVHVANPELALAFCQSHRVNSQGQVTGNWITHTSEFDDLFTEDFVIDGNKFIEKYLIHKNVIPNVSGVLFKKKNLLKISPLTFEPYMKYYADWFYYIQLLCNANVGFISESLNYFRYHERSVIGMAGKQSGWVKIFKMELAGRKKMVKYLEKCQPSNLNKIRHQSEVGNLKLRYLIAKGLIDRGEILRGFFMVRKSFFLTKKVLRFCKDKYLDKSSTFS